MQSPSPAWHSSTRPRLRAVISAAPQTAPAPPCLRMRSTWTATPNPDHSRHHSRQFFRLGWRKSKNVSGGADNQGGHEDERPVQEIGWRGDVVGVRGLDGATPPRPPGRQCCPSPGRAARTSFPPAEFFNFFTGLLSYFFGPTHFTTTDLFSSRLARSDAAAPAAVNAAMIPW